MICNNLSEMILELGILFHDKVAIQQFNKHKLMKLGGGVKYRLNRGILIQLSHLIKLGYQVRFLILKTIKVFTLNFW
jgi:hypothetical protein